MGCSRTGSRPWYVRACGCVYLCVQPCYLAKVARYTTGSTASFSTKRHAPCTHLVTRQRRQLQEDIIPQLASEPEQVRGFVCRPFMYICMQTEPAFDHTQ